jgi:hypothetical protein
MSTASKILIAAGMINLLVGGLSGIPMAMVRQRARRGAEVPDDGAPRRDPAWADPARCGVRADDLDADAVGRHAAAVVLAVASGLLIVKDTINWRQGVRDEFAEDSLGLKIGQVFGHSSSVSASRACVVSGL